MNNVLVVGALYSSNLGDDVLLETVANVCKKVRGVAPVLLSISGMSSRISDSTVKKDDKSYVCKRMLKKTKIYQLIIEYKRCIRLKKQINKIDLDGVDTIVFGGGQMFMDIFVPLINIIIEEAERKHINIIFNACGIGPLSSRNQKSLIRHLASPAVLSITLRDGIDKFNTMYNGCLNIYKVLDPAIECSSYFPRGVCKEKKIGLGLISPTILKKHGIDVNEELLLSIAHTVVKICERRKVRCEIFCNGDYDDYMVTKKIYNEINEDICYLSERPTNSRELTELVSSYDHIISFRLHSHIIAASYRIPTFGLVWDRKVVEFFHSVGRQQWTYKIEAEMDITLMEQRIEEFLDAPYALDLNSVPNSCEILSQMLAK